MIEISQIVAELKILRENIGEEKVNTQLTLDVAIQLLNEYRVKLKEQKNEYSNMDNSNS